MKIFYFNIFLVYVFVMWQQQRIEEEEEEVEKKTRDSVLFMWHVGWLMLILVYSYIRAAKEYAIYNDRLC